MVAVTDPARPSAGDPIPSDCAVIEVHVAELKQLFNAIDPSPFREKDLDPKATQRAEATRRRLRELFRVGRTSLLIGTTFLAISLVVGNFLAGALGGSTFGELVKEGLLIGGWVAMWRPMEIFLYDWWPIRDEARLLDRLVVMPVRIAYTRDAGSEAWRWDWPAVAPSDQTSRAGQPPPAGSSIVSTAPR
jgi:hypothetical protein